MLGKLLLGKLVTGEVSVREISGWGNYCLGSCDFVLGKLRWGNDLTPQYVLSLFHLKILLSVLYNVVYTVLM